MVAVFTIVVATSRNVSSEPNQAQANTTVDSPVLEGMGTVKKLNLTSQCHTTALELNCKDFDWQPSSFIGNNILGLMGAVFLALDRNLQITFKRCRHELLNVKALQSALPSCSAPKETIWKTDVGNSFVYYKVKKTDQSLDYRYPWFAPCVYQHYAQRLFDDRIVAVPEIDFENALIIHMRAGDIFAEKPHPKYGPPPLSFFVDAIEKNKDKQIYIITNEQGGYANKDVAVDYGMDLQAKKNSWLLPWLGNHPSPLVARLKQLYPNIKVVSGSLEHDVSAILQARYLVASQGTFAYALALCSRHLKTFYYHNNVAHVPDMIFLDIDVHYYETPGYFVVWKNTEEQRKQMFEYSREKLQVSRVRHNSGDCVVA